MLELPIGRSGRTRFFSRRRLPVILFAVLCVVPFILSVRATHDLTCPSGDCYFRDIAIARSIAQGHGDSDPAYAGEKLWYNPLFPALIAGVSNLTHVPVPVVSVRIGAYANLLGPIALFALLWTLFDGWIALAGAASFLFVIPASYPMLRWAPYTPWPVPSHFAQGVFYATLIVFVRALRSDRRLLFLATGALAGLTFLAHTAPAMMLAGIVGFIMLGAFVRAWEVDLASPRLYRVVVSSILTAVPAFLLASIFLRPLWVRYHLKILDPMPVTYLDESIQIEKLTATMGRELVSPWTALAVIGLFGLIIGKGIRRETRTVLLLWIGTSFTLLAYGYAYQGLVRVGISPPAIVPPHHYFFYCLIAKAVLIGLGSILAGRLVVGMAAYLLPALARRLEADGTDRRLLAARTLALAAIGLWVVTALPSYAKRQDFVQERDSARELAGRADMLGAMDWIAENTAPDAVLLAPPDQNLAICALTGRKVVSLDRLQSNPYVDGGVRERSRSLMWTELQAGNEEQFRYWAEKYGVRMILTEKMQATVLEMRKPPFLAQVYSEGDFRIFTLLPPSQVPAAVRSAAETGLGTVPAMPPDSVGSSRRMRRK